ncbi:hypothetical protein N665_0346s0008 [Sinapis alba]|nr:hypothetical protein N665_0346s0008 [Sinapis alba]
MKLQEASVIYLISDNNWVSLVPVVSKKGGITVVKNDKDELIPMRTITGQRMYVIKTCKPQIPLFSRRVLEILPDSQTSRRSRKNYLHLSLWNVRVSQNAIQICNAPATFQRCMMSIFTDMIEDFMEVFMDDFSVYGLNFKTCLDNLYKVLARCEEKNLVLNCEKCHFMVNNGILLGHKVPAARIEVDKAKPEVMTGLLPPANIKGVRSFLGHAEFYRGFIKDFSKIAQPLTALLCKEVKFDFTPECLEAFKEIKSALVSPLLSKHQTGIYHSKL